MSPQELLDELVELARASGLAVRWVPPAEDAASSGVCRLRDRVWVLLSGADPLERRLDVLAAALREHAAGLESRYLPPVVRARIEGAPRAPGGPPA